LWRETLKLMDLDENGLDYRQRKYLEILNEYGELSLKNIASLLKTTEENVEDMVEPLLFKKRLITITSKGRSLRKESSNI
jgi:Holliday junction DNA helicase RuvB